MSRLDRAAAYSAWTRTLDESDRDLLARHVPIMDDTDDNGSYCCDAHPAACWPCRVVIDVLHAHGKTVRDIGWLP